MKNIIVVIIIILLFVRPFSKIKKGGGGFEILNFGETFIQRDTVKESYRTSMQNLQILR
jgi:hypothetical protein